MPESGFWRTDAGRGDAKTGRRKTPRRKAKPPSSPAWRPRSPRTRKTRTCSTRRSTRGCRSARPTRRGRLRRGWRCREDGREAGKEGRMEGRRESPGRLDKAISTLIPDADGTQGRRENPGRMPGPRPGAECPSHGLRGWARGLGKKGLPGRSRCLSPRPHASARSPNASRRVNSNENSVG